jgi:hypothetical protein
MNKLKYIVVAQAVVIILLLGIILKLLFPPPGEYLPVSAFNKKLVSPRVYSKIIEPGSFPLVNFAPLKEGLVNYIEQNKFAISIYVESFKTGAAFGIGEKTGFMPAGLSKVLVAIMALKKVEKEKLDLNTGVDIEESDRVGLMRGKKKMPLKVLIKQMLSESDPTALKVLQRYIDREDKAVILNYVSYPIHQNIDSLDLGEDDENGLVTPKSVYNIFSSLYLSSILKPEHSEFILSNLVDTVFDVKKTGKLSNNVTIAHAFGARYSGEEKFFHDCGIMYIHSKDMRLFYCVMTKGQDEEIAKENIGSIVRAVYSYSLHVRNKFDYYKLKLYEPIFNKQGKRL